MLNTHDIYQRFLARKCTAQEVQQLMEHFREQENAVEILNLIQAELDRAEMDVIEQQDIASAQLNWSKLEMMLASKPSVRKLQTYWISAVACVLLLTLGAIVYLPKMVVTPKVTMPTVESINPGGNRATLTWADGSTIVLSETHRGIITGEELRYDDGSTISASKTALATLTTPRGGQYQITLPDGTKVWLNAASSLQYPSQFVGNERKVTLNGEAYFEVKHNASKPFIVYSAEQRTIVKGTKFNVSAYQEDKKTTTTLLEGSVAIQLMNGQQPVSSKEVLLTADQQAIVQDGHTVTGSVDASESMAWSQGKFMFTDAPLADIMRQIARWYDVEVVYLMPVEDATFTGSISRFERIQDVLRKIELTDRIKFEIQERRVMVKRE